MTNRFIRNLAGVSAISGLALVLACGGSDNTSDNVSNLTPTTPVAHGNAPTSVIGGHSYIINFSSSGGTGITYTASVQNSASSVSVASTTGAVTYKPALTGSGPDVITVKAKNTEGAESQPGTLTVSVTPNTSPALPERAQTATLSAGDGIKVSTTRAVPLSGFPLTDSDGDKIEWSVTGGTLGTAGGVFNQTGNTLTINTNNKANGNYTLEIRGTEKFNGVEVTSKSYTLNVIVGATSETGGGGTQVEGEATITTELPNNLMQAVQGLANHQAFWARTSESGTVNATKWEVKAGVSPEGELLNGADFEAWISTRGDTMPTAARGYTEIFIAAVQAQNTEDGVSERPFGELWLRPKSTVAVGDTTKWLCVVATFEDTNVKANKAWQINIGENRPPTLSQGSNHVITTTVKDAPWNSNQDYTYPSAQDATVSPHVVFQSAKDGSRPLTYSIRLGNNNTNAPTVTDVNFPAGDRVSVDLVDIKLGSTSIKNDFIASWNKGTILTLNGNVKAGDTTRRIEGPIEFQVPVDNYPGAGNDLVFTYKVTDGAGLSPSTGNLIITIPTSKNPEPIIDAYDATDRDWLPSSGDMRSVNGLTGWVSSQPAAGQSNQWTIQHNGATPQKLRVANPIPSATPTIATAWKVYMRTNDDNARWPVLPASLITPTSNWTINWTPNDPEDARTDYTFTLNAWNQYGAKAQPFTMSGQVWGRVLGEPVTKKIYLASAGEANDRNPVMSYPANFASWVDLKIAPRFDAKDALYPNQYGFDHGDPLNPPGYWNVEKKPGNDASAWRSSAVPPGYYLISARDFDIVGQPIINPVIGPAISGTYVTNPANPYQVPRTRPTYAYIQNDRPDLSTHAPYGALAGVIDTSITFNVNGELDANEETWYPGYWIDAQVPMHFTKFDDDNDKNDYEDATYADWTGDNEGLVKLNNVPFSGAMTLVGEGDLTGKGGVIQFVFRDASQKGFFDVVKQENLPVGLDRYPVEAYDKKDFTWTGTPGFATEVRVDPSDGGLSYRNIAFTLGDNSEDADAPGTGPLQYQTYRSDKMTLLAMKREPSNINGFNYWRASRTASPAAIPSITNVADPAHPEDGIVKLSSSFAPVGSAGVFGAYINRNSFIADLPFINGTNIPATTLKDTLQVVAYTSGTALGPVDNVNGLPTLIEFGQLAGNAGIPSNFSGTLTNLGEVSVPRPDRDYWYGDTTPVVHYTVNYTGTNGLPGSMGVATTKLDYTSNNPLTRGLPPITNVKITTKAWDANKSTIDASSSPITVYKANANSTSGANITALVPVRSFNNEGNDFHSVWLTWKNPKDNTGKTLNSGTIIEIFDLSDDTIEAAGGSPENVAPLFKVHVAPEVEEFPIPNEWVAALSGNTINAGTDYEYVPAANGPVAQDPSSIVIRMRAVRYGDESAGNFVNFDKTPFKAAFPAYWIDTITSRLDFDETEIGKITVWEDNMTVNLNHALMGTFSKGSIQLRTTDPHDNNLHFTIDGSTASDRNGEFEYTWTLKSVTPVDGAFVGTPTADNQMRNMFQFVGTGNAGDGSDGTTNRYRFVTTTLGIPAIQISGVGDTFLANVKSANLVLTLSIKKQGTAISNTIDVPVALEAAWWQNPVFTLNPTPTATTAITNYVTDLQPTSGKQITWRGPETTTMPSLVITDNTTNVTPGTTGLTYRWEIVPNSVAAFTGASDTNNGTAVTRIVSMQTDVVLVPSVDADKTTQSSLALPKVYIVNNNNLWTSNPTAIVVNRVTFNLRARVYWNGMDLGLTTNNLPVDFRPAAAPNAWTSVTGIMLNTSILDDHGLTSTMDVAYGTAVTNIPTQPANLLVTRSATSANVVWETTEAANLANLVSTDNNATTGNGSRWQLAATPVFYDANDNIVNNVAWNSAWLTGLDTTWVSGVDVTVPAVTLTSNAGANTDVKAELESKDVRKIELKLQYQVKPTTGSTPILTSVNAYTLNLKIPMRTLTVNDWTTVSTVSFPVGASAFGHLEAGDVTPDDDPTITYAGLVFKNAAGNPLTGMSPAPSATDYLWTVVSAQGYGETGSAVGGNAKSSFTVKDADKNKVTIPTITVASGALTNNNIVKYVVGLNLRVTAGGKNFTTGVPLEVTFGPDMTDVVSVAFPTEGAWGGTATNDYKTAVAAVPVGLTLPTPSELVILNAAGKNIAGAMQLDTLTYTWVQDAAGIMASLDGNDDPVNLPTFAWDSNGVVSVAFPSLAIPSLKFTEKTASDFPNVVNKVGIPMNLKLDDGTNNKTTTTPIVISVNTIAP